MVNEEYILKQKILGSQEKKYFEGQHQAYITYSKIRLTGLIQYLYDYRGTISPMDTEENEQKIKQ